MSAAVDTPAVVALNEALRLAEHGYKLAPVTITRAANGKKSFEFHVRWRHESAWSRDPDQIRAWWADRMDTSFAIGGAANGIELVDLDVKPAEGIDAVTAWAERGLPVSSFMQRTPSGGMHNIWRTRADGLTLPQEAGKTLGRGIDTRNRSGLVIAAGAYILGEEDHGHYVILGELPRLDELEEVPLDVIALFAEAAEAEREHDHARGGGFAVHDEQWQRAQVDLALLAIREHDRATGGYRAKLQHAGLFYGRAVEQDFLTEAVALEKILDAHRSVWGPAVWPENVKDIRDALRDGPRLERWRVPSIPTAAVSSGAQETAHVNGATVPEHNGHQLKPANVTDAPIEGAVAAYDEEEAQRRAYENEVAAVKRQMLIRRDATALIIAEQRPPDPGPALTSLAALLAEPDETESYRIDQLWPVGGKVLLSAPQKSGKTTLVGNLVRALADGAPFLSRPSRAGEWKVAAAGYETTPLEEGRRIALFDFEMTRHKLKDWLRDQRIANPDAVHVELMRGRLWDIRDLEVRAQWATALRELNVSIIMVDPIGPVLGALGIEENDATAAGGFLFALDALVRESGADELFVTHHTGHNAERARGSSAFLGWPDASWTIVRDEMSTQRAFKAEGRDVWVPETALVYDPATRRLGLGEGDRSTSRSAGDVDTIVGIITESPGETLRGLQKLARETELGTKEQRTRDAVTAAHAAGAIHVHLGPNRARLHMPGPCSDTCTERSAPLAEA